MKNFVEQEELILNRTKNQIRLNDLFVRPSIGKKRVQGVLEAHVNGFQYQQEQWENKKSNGKGSMEGWVVVSCLL